MMMMMESSSESSSDVDLPSLDLLLSGGPDKAGPGDVMMISDSDDDDDEDPYVPLALRLQQKHKHVMSTESSDDQSSSSHLHHHHHHHHHHQEPLTTQHLHHHHHQEPLTTQHLHHHHHHQEPLTTQQGPSTSRKISSTYTTKMVQDQKEETVRKRKDQKEETVRKRKDQKEETVRKRKDQKEEAVRKRKDQKEETVRKRKDQKEETVRKRKDQERMKAERKAAAEAVKALRPEECLKHMEVMVDPALLQQEGGGALLAALQTLGCSCSIEKQTLPRSIAWRRRGQTGDEGTSEPIVLMHVTVDVFVSLVHGYIQESLDQSDCGATLTSWVLERQRQHQDKTLSLVLIGLDHYFRSQTSVKKNKRAETITGEEGGPEQTKRRRRGDGAVEAQIKLTRVQVEEAVVHLQLHTGVPVHFLSTWQDFCNHVTMVTKAVAETPFKRSREQTGFSFHLDSEWAGGQRVDRGGRGLIHVWKRQIQQLNRVSGDMAAAVIAAYPSPQILLEAYGVCSSDHQRTSLLSDLLIRRGEGITSTSRRVGPELSKRIFLFITSTDPEQTLDSTA